MRIVFIVQARLFLCPEGLKEGKKAMKFVEALQQIQVAVEAVFFLLLP